MPKGHRHRRHEVRSRRRRSRRALNELMLGEDEGRLEIEAFDPQPFELQHLGHHSHRIAAFGIRFESPDDLDSNN